MALTPIDIVAELQRLSAAAAAESASSSQIQAEGSEPESSQSAPLTLEKHKNVLFVRNKLSEGFTRYRLSIEDGPRSRMFLRILLSPTVVTEGIVWIPSFGSFFTLTEREIRRGKIYVTNSKQYVPSSSEISVKRVPTKAEFSAAANASGSTADNPTNSDSSRDAELESVDRAFNEQIGTLLNLLNSEGEEEWSAEMPSGL